jgi:hypothetical protein
VAFSCIQNIQVQLRDDFFEIKAHVFCIWCAHNTILMQFFCVYVCSADTEFTIVRDQISHGRNVNAVWIVLLGAVINNGICKSKDFFCGALAQSWSESL